MTTKVGCTGGERFSNNTGEINSFRKLETTLVGRPRVRQKPCLIMHFAMCILTLTMQQGTSRISNLSAHSDILGAWRGPVIFLPWSSGT